MASMPFFCAAISALLFTSFAAFGQSAQQLPNAPPASSPAHASGDPTFAPSKWYGVVDPGETVPPLYPRDKMVFWIHEDIRPAGWIPAIISSGFGQLTTGDPDYGSDSAAFGDRLGAAVIRDTSMRFFSDSLLPTFTHEDPRYYREAYGSIGSRAKYAAERTLISQRDNGSSGFNYSVVFGHLIASALTPTYYPAPSANGRVVVTTWVLSLAGDAGGKLFAEFWPDARDLIFHRRRKRP
jgi:hypothetical protein